MLPVFATVAQAASFAGVHLKTTSLYTAERLNDPFKSASSSAAPTRIGLSRPFGT